MPLDDTATLLADRYTILEPLGRGAFAEVFKGRSVATGELVALKIARGPADGRAATLLREESRVAARLSHPSIPPFLDGGVCADAHYAAFAFVDGTTLREVLRREARLAEPEAAHAMAQVLEALASAHAVDIVHCDLKPEHVLLTASPAPRDARVLDFGLAACAAGDRSPGFAGTAAYAAPEQLRGGPMSPSVDIYAWGLVLLEALTGRLPRGRNGASALQRLADDSVIVPDDLRRHPLGRAVELATIHDPARRAEMLPEIRALLAEGADLGRACIAGTRAAVRAPTRETPHVGRVAEIARLLSARSMVAAGRDRAVMIVGEAGIGKTHLLRELGRREPSDGWIELRCAPESRTTPLQPLVETLLGLADSVDDLLDRCGLDPATHGPLLTALLQLPPDPRHPPLNVTPDRQKELLLRVAVRLLRRLVTGGPVAVVAVENLHWADPTTLELLRRLVHADARNTDDPALLVVCTTRPEGLPAWATGRTDVLLLDRLAQDDVEALVRGLAGSAVSPDVMARLVRRAEGVPLFAEELTRLLHERPNVAANDPLPVTADTVPTTIRGLLTARLDAVSLGARATAQLAAVLGRDFSYDLLETASVDDRARVTAHVSELMRSGVLVRAATSDARSCRFRHALFRDAAYEATEPDTRRRLHRRAAETLENRFQTLATQRPELVAMHYEQGGEIELALTRWLAAAHHSYRRAAYEESFAQSEHALTLVTDPPPATHRLPTVDLLVARGTALFSLQGWAAPEVERTFERAWQLASAPGEEVPPQVLYGIWGVQILRSNRGGVERLLPHFTRHAFSTDPIAAHMGESCLGIAAFWRGDFPAALSHLHCARERYRAEQRESPYDAGIYSYAFGFCALWTAGRVTDARRLRAEAFDIAERRGDPYSVAVVLAFASMMAHDCGDLADAREWSHRLMQLAEEQHLYPFWAPGAVAYGRALAESGDLDAGIATIYAGLERYRLLGVMASYAYYQYYLASALLAADRVSDAAAAVDEGLRLCDELYVRFHESELVRVRGIIELRRGDRASAERSFRTALTLAERKGAVAFQLRAATELARSATTDDTAAEHRATVRRLVAAIDAGDTADVRAARALLTTG